MTASTSHALAQAEHQLAHIKELVAQHERAAKEALETESRSKEIVLEKAIEAIREHPLSVLVRSDWREVGSHQVAPYAEYQILLCTGGPAVKIEGQLGKGSPETARLFYQDWGTPWIVYPLSAANEAIVISYCERFYYGE